VFEVISEVESLMLYVVFPILEFVVGQWSGPSGEPISVSAIIRSVMLQEALVEMRWPRYVDIKMYCIRAWSM
jgi:hypothetical protein